MTVSVVYLTNKSSSYRLAALKTTDFKLKMLLSKQVAIIVLCIVTSQVHAKPNCQTLGYVQKDVVCTAGPEDYELQRGLVSDNDKTTGITLRDCKIKEIKQESFKNLPSLQYIDLSINKIENLHLGVLDGTRQVSYLNLSYNLISELELGIFDQKPNLEVLDLRSNKLKALKLGVFDPLRKLGHLDLSDNLLKGSELNPFVFDKSRGIKFLDFSRNVMSDSKDNLLKSFQSLDFLNLDRCFIKNNVPIFVRNSNLRTVRHIILSTNQIDNLRDATTFVNLDNLEILDLSFNSIDIINEDVFKPLRKLKKILLRHNNLRTISENLFQNIPNLGLIDLSYNRLEYIPVNALRGTSVKILNLSHNKFSFLENNFVLELRNSGAKLTKFYFNDNPWQCACLRELLNELRSYSVQYNSYKYTGKVIVCTIKKSNKNCMRHVSENEDFSDMYFSALRIK